MPWPPNGKPWPWGLFWGPCFTLIGLALRLLEALYKRDLIVDSKAVLGETFEVKEKPDKFEECD